MAFNLHAGIEMAEKHPLATGAGVFVIGLIGLYLMGAFKPAASGDASGSDPGAVSAYFGAEAAQAESGNQLQETQILAQASTAQALANDNAAQNIQTTWANAGVSQTTSNNDAALSLAPYAAQASLASDLAAIAASAPPTTTTTAKVSNGFGLFGLGASKSQTTTVSASPVSANISDELAGMLNGFHPQNG